MPTTETSEKGLEILIVASLVAQAGIPAGGQAALGDSRPGAAAAPRYVAGNWQDYDRDHAVDSAKLLNFLEATQPKTVTELKLPACSAGRYRRTSAETFRGCGSAWVR